MSRVSKVIENQITPWRTARIALIWCKGGMEDWLSFVFDEEGLGAEVGRVWHEASL